MTFHLLFDLDDTLIDNNIDAFILTYFKKLSAFMAAHVPPEQFIQSLMNASGHMYASDRVDQTLEQVFSANFYHHFGKTRFELAADLEHFYDEIFPKLNGATAPRPVAVEIVKWAVDQGWKVSVATDPLFPRKAILHRLRWAGLAPEDIPFTLISDFETFHFAKATVAYFPEFLIRAGWKDDEPLIMIGDSIERDIIPAKKAGIPAFWLKAEGQSDPGAEGLPQGGLDDLKKFLASIEPSTRKATGQSDPNAEGLPQGSLTDLKNFLAAVDPSTLKADFSSPSAMLAWLRATPAIIHGVTEAIAPDAWTSRPQPAEWSFTEILCHLRDVDAEVNLPRIHAVLNEENPFIAGQVTDPWAEEREYILQDGPLAFRGFVAARLKLLDMLSKLPPEAWERTARHTIFGPTTLRELVNFMVEHDRAHARQAFALLG
jgi:FMN phosphatase YigB (HAD superfamily)